MNVDNAGQHNFDDKFKGCPFTNFGAMNPGIMVALELQYTTIFRQLLKKLNENNTRVTKADL